MDAYLLETERLRPYRPEDLEDLFAIVSDPETKRAHPPDRRRHRGDRARLARGQAPLDKGMATEAAAACRDRCFDPLGLDRLIALVRPINTPSARVAEKIGMRVEREAQYHHFLHHVYVTTPNDAHRGGR